MPLDSELVILCFTICMVRVEAPPAPERPSNWPMVAFKKRAKSTPLCWKNLESSVATKASTNTSGI